MTAQDLIGEYMTHLRERSCTERTITTYAYHLTQADMRLPYGLDTSTEQEIRSWLWREGLAPSSRALVHSALSGFFTWAIRAGELDFNPAAEIPRPRVPVGLPRVASDESVEMLVLHAREPYRLWAELAAYAALRCIEVYRLDRAHITEQEIRVYGKGSKYRLVPTHPRIWQSVKDLPAGPVSGAPSERRISTNFQRYCLAEKLPNMSMHRLRAWCATKMYRATKDLQAVQRLLGHANLATTARYLGMGEDVMRAAINALPELGVHVDPRRDRSAR